jgi:hypothetical protein
MSKKIGKKLEIRKATMASLNVAELNQVEGGYSRTGGCDTVGGTCGTGSAIQTQCAGCLSRVC